MAPAIPPLHLPAFAPPEPDRRRDHLVLAVLLVAAAGFLLSAMALPHLGIFIMLGFAAFAGVVYTIHHDLPRRRVLADLRRQIAARPPNPDAWGDDPRRLRLAELTCHTLAREMKWPNPHFLPDDPLDLLFFNVQNLDPIELDLVARALEDAAGKTVAWQQLVPSVLGRKPTLGDLVDLAV